MGLHSKTALLLWPIGHKKQGRGGSQQLCMVILVHWEQVQTQLCHNTLHSPRPRITQAVRNCSVAISSSENKGVPDNAGKHLPKGKKTQQETSVQTCRQALNSQLSGVQWGVSCYAACHLSRVAAERRDRLVSQQKEPGGWSLTRSAAASLADAVLIGHTLLAPGPCSRVRAHGIGFPVFLFVLFKVLRHSLWLSSPTFPFTPPWP